MVSAQMLHSYANLISYTVLNSLSLPLCPLKVAFGRNTIKWKTIVSLSPNKLPLQLSEITPCTHISVSEIREEKKRERERERQREREREMTTGGRVSELLLIKNEKFGVIQMMDVQRLASRRTFL